MGLFKLAYLNVVRRRSQSLLTGILTALTIFAFVLIFSIFFIIQDGLNLTTDRLGADIIVIPNDAEMNVTETLFTGAEQNIYMDKGVETVLNQIPGIKRTTPQFFTATLEGASCCSPSETLRIVGIDHKSDFILKPWFEEYNVSALADNEIILGSDITGELGNKFLLLGDMFNVAGTLYTTGSSMDNTIFMNIETARRLANIKYSAEILNGDTADNLVSAILIESSSKGLDVENIISRIDNENLNIRAISISNSISNVKQQLNAISKIILILWVIFLVSTSISLISRFNSLAESRRKEIGYLRAVGLTKKEIFRIIILESWIISGLGGIIGSIIGTTLVKPVLSIISEIIIVPKGQWSLYLSLIAIIIGIFFALLLGFLASIFPAWKSSNLEPQEAIAKGDVR